MESNYDLAKAHREGLQKNLTNITTMYDPKLQESLHIVLQQNKNPAKIYTDAVKYMHNVVPELKTFSDRRTVAVYQTKK